METRNGPAGPTRAAAPTAGEGGPTEPPVPPVGDDSDTAPSTTAVGAAALRAAHLLIDEPPPILDDPVSLRLLDPEAEEAIRAGAERLRRPGSLALRCGIVVRSRFAEDRLATSVMRDGVDQFVLLGAGLDTFAYRQPRWARPVRIFEVDLPAGQADKRARLARAGIAEPRNVGYVAADFGSQDLVERLAVSGFDPRRPAFAAGLGVLIYLTVESVERVFDAVSKLAAGTRFVFTFTRPQAGPPAAASAALRAGSVAGRVAALGEPWRSFMEPAAVEEGLRRRGFRVVTFTFAEDVAREYLAGRSDGLYQPARAVLADAIL
jgi:methyltransferase (TIGR00027 family)